MKSSGINERLNNAQCACPIPLHLRPRVPRARDSFPFSPLNVPRDAQPGSGRGRIQKAIFELVSLRGLTLTCMLFHDFEELNASCAVCCWSGFLTSLILCEFIF